jgi:crossover junction endodeoxyribonuclease RuvC
VFDGPVLGIDPGLTRCGYGVVERRGGATVAVACGVLRTPAADPLPQRLASLEEELGRLLAEVAPTAVAVERLLFQHNVRTAVAVGQASGVVLAAAARAGVPVAHYSPNEVKLAVTGSGTADKRQVEAMVVRVLSLEAPPGSFDAADALALALCHSWGAPLRRAAEPGETVASRGFDRAVAAALAREEAS